MYSKNSFGNFYPVESIIHKLNPVVKLINFAIAMVIVFLSKDLQINLFLFALVAFSTFFSNVPTRFYFKAFYSLRFIYVLIIFICLYFRVNPVLIVVYILKIVIVLEYLFVIVYTTSPSELNYAIEKILNIFNIFRLNMAKISIKITNFLRFIPLVITTEMKILKSQSSRGIDYNNSGILGRVYAASKAYSNVLRLSIEKSRDIKRNEEIRLFDIKKKRTNYRTNKVGFYDVMFILFHLCMIFALLLEKGVLNEVLTKFFV